MFIFSFEDICLVGKTIQSDFLKILPKRKEKPRPIEPPKTQNLEASLFLLGLDFYLGLMYILSRVGGKPYMKINWDKVQDCNHENSYPDYMVPLYCDCNAHEFHCKSCGIYFNDCKCGEVQGVSTKPHKYWKNKECRTIHKIKVKYED